MTREHLPPRRSWGDVLDSAETYLGYAKIDVPSRPSARPHLVKLLAPILPRYPSLRDALGGGKDFASLFGIVEALRAELGTAVGDAIVSPYPSWYRRHRDRVVSADEQVISTAEDRPRRDVM